MAMTVLNMQSPQEIEEQQKNRAKKEDEILNDLEDMKKRKENLRILQEKIASSSRRNSAVSNISMPIENKAEIYDNQEINKKEPMGSVTSSKDSSCCNIS